MKRNLFESKTFAILEDSFADVDDLDCTKRLLIENGGRVVEANAKANYAIFEDGHDPEIWKVFASGGVDSMNRNIVHPRWVEKCVKEGQLFDHLNAYHLSPLPMKVPLA